MHPGTGPDPRWCELARNERAGASLPNSLGERPGRWNARSNAAQRWHPGRLASPGLPGLNESSYAGERTWEVEGWLVGWLVGRFDFSSRLSPAGWRRQRWGGGW